MTKQRISLIFTALFLTTASFAQLNFSMKAGTCYARHDINFGGGGLRKDDDSQRSGGSMAMAFSVPVKGKFRLGAEIGLNNIGTFFDFTVPFTPTSESTYFGHYRTNQAYFAVAPEFRPIKSLYINAGAGFYNEIISQFTSGERTTPTDLGLEIEDITGWEIGRGESVGYFVGVGFCPNLTKELAFLLELRYTSSPAGSSNDQIYIGYNAIGFNVGLMYKPKS